MFRAIRCKSFRKTNRHATAEYSVLEPRSLMAGIELLPSGDLEITGTAGNDSAEVRIVDSQVQASLNSLTRSFNVESVIRIKFFGLDGNDYFRGHTMIPVSAFGGTGHDAISSGGGNDLIYGGPGNDVVFANGGHDIVNGGTGNDVLRGGGGNDRLAGAEGDDTMFGEDGQDFLIGAWDNDVLKGGNGNDKLFGDGGNDNLDGEAGADEISSGAGFNRSLFDAQDRFNDSEFIEGRNGARSIMKADFLNLSRNQMVVATGENYYNFTISNTTVIRQDGVVIPAPSLTNSHSLTIQFDNLSGQVFQIDSSRHVIDEGDDTANELRAGAQRFTLNMMHVATVSANSRQANDIDWFVFRSNYSGRVRINVSSPLSQLPPAHNASIETASGTVLAQTDVFGTIGQNIEVNLVKGKEYFIRMTGLHLGNTFLSVLPAL